MTDYLTITREVMYNSKVYLVDSENKVYIPRKLAAYIDPKKHNSILNYREVTDSELVKKILDYKVKK